MRIIIIRYSQIWFLMDKLIIFLKTYVFIGKGDIQRGNTERAFFCWFTNGQNSQSQTNPKLGARNFTEVSYIAAKSQ